MIKLLYSAARLQFNNLVFFLCRTSFQERINGNHHCRDDSSCKSATAFGDPY